MSLYVSYVCANIFYLREGYKEESKGESLKKK